MEPELLRLSIEVRAQTMIPTRYGPFEFIVFHSLDDTGRQHGLSPDHLALVRGDVRGKSHVLVRVHSECITSEVFSSMRCDCHEQLVRAQKAIEESDLGVLVYLRQEGRGIGLANKLHAYNLQHGGHDTVEANLLLGLPEDDRDYQPAADILRHLGVESIRLITNNPRKIEALQFYGISIEEQVPAIVKPNTHSANYLDAKRRRMGHMLPEHYFEDTESERATLEPAALSSNSVSPGDSV